MLTDKEMTEVLGSHDGGTSHASSLLSICTWVNESDHGRATLIVSAPGTAPGGQLPPGSYSKAGPEGLKLGDEDDTAQFVVGDRLCWIQVLTDARGSALISTLVRLAGLVRERV